MWSLFRAPLVKSSSSCSVQAMIDGQHLLTQRVLLHIIPHNHVRSALILQSGSQGGSCRSRLSQVKPWTSCEFITGLTEEPCDTHRLSPRADLELPLHLTRMRLDLKRTPCRHFITVSSVNILIFFYVKMFCHRFSSPFWLWVKCKFICTSFNGCAVPSLYLNSSRGMFHFSAAAL